VPEQIAIPLDQCEVYAFADLAAGADAKIGRRTCRQTVLVGARDWLDRWFILQAWAGRISTVDFKDKILAAHERFRPKVFGLEANGMQILFGQLVIDEGKRLLGKVNFFPVHQPTKVKKPFRIRTGLDPVMKEGRLFLQNKWDDLAQEIRGFPTAATVDLIDSLVSMFELAPKMPKRKGRDVGLEKLARYLRETGCPHNEMERRLEEYRVKNRIQLN
jgi:hypothetical protein